MRGGGGAWQAGRGVWEPRIRQYSKEVCCVLGPGFAQLTVFPALSGADGGCVLLQGARGDSRCVDVAPPPSSLPFQANLGESSSHLDGWGAGGDSGHSLVRQATSGPSRLCWVSEPIWVDSLKRSVGPCREEARTPRALCSDFESLSHCLADHPRAERCPAFSGALSLASAWPTERFR